LTENTKLSGTKTLRATRTAAETTKQAATDKAQRRTTPSPVEAQLIIRAARLACHLEIWDERTIPNGGAFTATGHNHYIAWSNSLTRTLARLGMQPAEANEPPGAALDRHLHMLVERQAAKHDEDEAA
jgi:hypothetical protein